MAQSLHNYCDCNITIRVLLSLLTSLSFVSSFYFTSLSFRTIHHRHPQFSIAPFNPLSAFLERNHVLSSATYHPLELASRTTCVVRSTCTGTMKKHAAAVSFIAPASTETAVVAGAGGATNVDGAAAGEGCKRLHHSAPRPSFPKRISRRKILSSGSDGHKPNDPKM